MPPIKFVIIDANILMCIGLQQLLTKMLPMAEFAVYASLEEMERQEDANQVTHYFVSSRIYFEHANFFREHPHKNIVLVNGDMQIKGVFTLNVCQSEASLIHDILKLQKHGHGKSHDYASALANSHEELLLSTREIEVAVLLCKGFINKEIADRLDISISTVITHRKNIMEKLHARSLVDIILYSIMNGLVNIEDL